jgi:hypothetical protein
VCRSTARAPQQQVVGFRVARVRAAGVTTPPGARSVKRENGRKGGRGERYAALETSSLGAGRPQPSGPVRRRPREAQLPLEVWRRRRAAPGWIYVAHEKLDTRNDVWLEPALAEALREAFGEAARPGEQFLHPDCRSSGELSQ